MKSQSKYLGLLFIVVFLIVCLPFVSQGEIRDLSAQELKAMLDSNQPLFLLNPLSDIEFNEGHIPGSVNVPLHTMVQSKKMPKDLKTPIVTYCLSKK